jgi:hypothetical protein
VGYLRNTTSNDDIDIYQKSQREQKGKRKRQRRTRKNFEYAELRASQAEV